MRVLYPMRPDALSKPGGDTNQIKSYIEYGKASGKFEGTICVDLSFDAKYFDIVHLTNIDRPVECWAQMRCAREQGNVALVVSPIHHSYTDIQRYEKQARRGSLSLFSGRLGFRGTEYLRALARCGQYPSVVRPLLAVIFTGMKSCQIQILDEADRIFLLSNREGVDLSFDLQLPIQNILDKSSVIRNGTSLDISTGEKVHSVKRDIDFLMVGRIEARKNQLAVIRALNEIGAKGVFVGAENKNHSAYCRDFHSLVRRGRHCYLGAKSSVEVEGLMRRSLVHVSASWFEVSSLVDLEAFNSGCSVVSSTAGATVELLGNAAVYLDPGNSDSVRDALLTARDRVCANTNAKLVLTWDEVGAQLVDEYLSILK